MWCCGRVLTLLKSQDFCGARFGVARFKVPAERRDRGRDRLALKEKILLQIAKKWRQNERLSMR